MTATAPARTGATAVVWTMLLTLLFAVQAAFVASPSPVAASDAQIIRASRAKLLAVQTVDGAKLVQLVSRGAAANPDVRGKGRPPLPAPAVNPPRPYWSPVQAISNGQSQPPRRLGSGDPRRTRAPPHLG